MTVNGRSVTPTKTYTYDGLGRRITESQTISGVTTTTDLYYSNQWQVLEEDTVTSGSTTSEPLQYVWSPVYVNAMVLRDQYTITNGVVSAPVRLYVEQDANWNVTALVGYNSTTRQWGVVERFAYTPFGQVTMLNPTTWAPHSDGYNSGVYVSGRAR